MQKAGHYLRFTGYKDVLPFLAEASKSHAHLVFLNQRDLGKAAPGFLAQTRLEAVRTWRCGRILVCQRADLEHDRPEKLQFSNSDKLHSAQSLTMPRGILEEAICPSLWEMFACRK